MKNLIACLFIIIFCLTPKVALGGDFVEDSQGSANSEGDSTFDPFSDYSEFEEGSEEESDVNFFHNGRFFTVGLIGGYEMFTDVLGQLYQPSFGYGGFISYFFDLRFAIQVGFLASSHSLGIYDGRSNIYLNGNVGLQRFEFDVKYYFNTQKVTRGLGAINPYILLGTASYTRTITLNGQQGFLRDSEFGFQGGVGIEFPLMKNKMFIGAEALYNYVLFPDKGTPLQTSSGATNIIQNGDIIQGLGFIGFNF